jgi:hypothetical protein
MRAQGNTTTVAIAAFSRAPGRSLSLLDSSNDPLGVRSHARWITVGLALPGPTSLEAGCTSAVPHGADRVEARKPYSR